METIDIDEARKHRRMRTQRWLATYQPGKASRFILPFSSLTPGQKVCLVLRKSTPYQGPMEAQEHFLREAVQKAQATIVEVFPYKGSGKSTEWFTYLKEAAILAGKHEAVLLAACTDRFLRSEKFWPRGQAWKYQANEEELQNLKEAVGETPLMTFLNPDAPPNECKGLLSKWGQQYGRNPGGKPLSRKGRRHRFFPRVLSLAEEGLSSQKISDAIIAQHGVRIPRRTISRWLLADKTRWVIPIPTVAGL
jgi:hypothetical protein